MSITNNVTRLLAISLNISSDFTQSDKWRYTVHYHSVSYFSHTARQILFDKAPNVQRSKNRKLYSTSFYYITVANKTEYYTSILTGILTWTRQALELHCVENIHVKVWLASQKACNLALQYSDYEDILDFKINLMFVGVGV